MVTTPQITIAQESLLDCWEEVQPLLRRHFEEMPHHDGTFDPDKDLYERGEFGGIWRCFTLRAEGHLVGYACFAIHPSPWHKGQREASNHSLYVDPAHRGIEGVAFLRSMLTALKAEGVKRIRVHVHVGRPEKVIFNQLGFTDVHIEQEMEL